MSYGQSKYGVSRYAETIDKASLEKFRISLLKYIPPEIYYEKTFNKIYTGQEYSLAEINFFVDDIKKQFFINTATWGLSLWEEEFGLPTNLNYSYEDRREVLKAKKRGQGTCTKELIKSVAEAFSGGECIVLENTAPYTFTIRFVGIKGIPRNMQKLINAINEIKPAHMLYNFKYTYTSWDYLDGKKLSYNKVESMKWDELEIYD